jgi:GT2 family glycosyltransferase
MKQTTLPHRIEVIVVDNGSRRDRSRRFFTELADDERFRVISRPEPFNFSKLCNDAAHEARSPTLVFLNNDTQALAEDWLGPLLHWAQQKDVGAVGANIRMAACSMPRPYWVSTGRPGKSNMRSFAF